jgi:hypothetical protein
MNLQVLSTWCASSFNDRLDAIVRLETAAVVQVCTTSTPIARIAESDCRLSIASYRQSRPPVSSEVGYVRAREFDYQHRRAHPHVAAIPQLERSVSLRTEPASRIRRGAGSSVGSRVPTTGSSWRRSRPRWNAQ